MLLLALTGCLWSGRLDRYEVWLDDPANARVTVDAVGGRSTALEPGEASREVTVDGHALTFHRDDGVRLACATCYGPMILVASNGKLQTTFAERALDLAVGEPFVAYRPYYLVREGGWQVDWLGAAWYHEHSEAVGLGIGADWSHVSRIEAFQKPNRLLGWGLLAAAGFATLPGLLLVGEPRGVVPGVLVLAGVGVAGWTGVRLITREGRKVLVYSAGDASLGRRPLR